MDKALDKSSDIATLMTNNMTGLISKLSDDIGVMANRILSMEERIGMMADRIVHTEELMAKLTASLADKELDLPRRELSRTGAIMPPLISVATTRISEVSTPEMSITGNPDVHLLYVSATPLFSEGHTVISRINSADDYLGSWRRSIEAIKRMDNQGAKKTGESMVVSVAVKTVIDDHRISPLSNSVEVTVYL